MKILLLCNAGMSTSLLVEKMKKEAQNCNDDVFIEAYPVEDLDKVADNFDVILLGPQVKFKEKMISEVCNAHKKPFAFIPLHVYGLVDGKKALELALDLIKKKGDLSGS
ncbi:MAG: PTS sugar transporter subunit IIB [Thermovenabulum sp.]|uniref:PTS sugar transporter subunit IIB n=1 Tax=Thermovenabulum sp. TaxID=3100335 RepID=UPI003C7C8D18